MVQAQNAKGDDVSDVGEQKTRQTQRERALRLTGQEQVATQDALGGAIITWTTTKQVWGGVEALSGSESFKADQVTSQLQLRIVIRYGSEWSSIDTTWRVQEANSGKNYGIQAVVNPEHRSRPNTVIELQCFESDRDNQSG